MSYGIGLNFAKAENKEQAFDTMQDFLSSIWNKKYEWLELNKYYIPSVQRGSDAYANELWLTRLFRFKFIYWEKYGLLAVQFTDNLTIEAIPHFVYFQNSCDQDYKFEQWPDLPFFNEIVQKCKNMSSSEIKEKADMLWDDDWGGTEEYCRCSIAYKMIEDKLSVQKILDFEDGDYEKFIMSPPCNEMEMFKLEVYMKKYIRENGLN